MVEGMNEQFDELHGDLNIHVSNILRELNELKISVEENILCLKKPESHLNQFGIFHSEELNELFEAMSKAQGEMGKLISNKENPFYKAQYPTLDVVIDVYREPLSNHGLTFMQWSLTGGKMLNWMGHKSGQYISNVEELRIKDPSNPQAHGSAYSYLRRYSAMGIFGLGKASSDDDGNVASQEPDKGASRGSGKSKTPKKGNTPKTPPDEFSQQLADQGTVEFPPIPEDETPPKDEPNSEEKAKIISDAKTKMDESTVITHLQNIWNKHQKEWRETLGKEILQVQEYKEKKKEELVKIRDQKDIQKTEETEGV